MALSFPCPLLAEKEGPIVHTYVFPVGYSYYGGPQLIGPMVHTRTYIVTYFYQQHLVLFTMAPRYSSGENVTRKATYTNRSAHGELAEIKLRNKLLRGTIVIRTKYC